MYLVDTSVWIDYIQGRNAKQVSFLDELLKNPLAVGITDLIYMEILQGAKDQKNLDRLRRYLAASNFIASLILNTAIRLLRKSILIVGGHGRTRQFEPTMGVIQQNNLTGEIVKIGTGLLFKHLA